MQKLSTLLLFLLTGTLSYSQNDDSGIPFVAYWELGDMYNFKITNTVEKWSKGEQVKDEKQTYIATFEVIDSTATSYIINWTYENDLINTFDIPEDMMDRFSEYETIGIDYKTTETGELVEILNWQEVGDAMYNMMDIVVQVLAQDDPESTKSVEKIIKPFKEIYSSKEGVEQLVLKELQYFHSPMGYEYVEDEVLEYEDQLPNMFGGAPIKGLGSIRIEDHNPEAAFCVLRQELALDPDDTKAMMKQAFKGMGINDSEIKNMLKTAVFEINDINIFEYFYYPGIPKRIETERVTNMVIGPETGKRIDRTVIELID